MARCRLAGQGVGLSVGQMSVMSSDSGPRFSSIFAPASSLAPVLLVGALGLALTFRVDGARPTSEPCGPPPPRSCAITRRPDYRVEVVPTSAHWEAYYLPRAGF